jgi:hypothetical protein
MKESSATSVASLKVAQSGRWGKLTPHVGLTIGESPMPSQNQYNENTAENDN